MRKKKTTEEFIEEARKVHGDKYDYSKVEYINSKTKVCIICSIHGEFWQLPGNHLKGYGCNKCSHENLALAINEFIEKAIKVYGNKYDYSKANYVNGSTKVCIICPKHGEFWQLPGNHLKGHGCPKCSSIVRWEKRGKETTESFIFKAKQIHGDKYNYSKVKYISCDEKVCIICPEHGEFWQRPCCHLKGAGCKKCSDKRIGKMNSSNAVTFISKAKEIHNNKYDYSKVEYINNRTKVCIICKEHGEFWQTPSNHLKGKGCPKCKESRLEKHIMLFLDKENINYVFQKQFDWLKYNGKLYLDFYLPDYNVAIECQGEQHFIQNEFFGGKDGLDYSITRDTIKNSLCNKNGVKVFYYSNLGIEYPYKVFEDENNLLSEIKKMEKKWINLIFIVDESGSMYSSQHDVIGGFKKMIEEQQKVKDGELTISLFTFNNEISEKYVGVDVNEIGDFEYKPGGMTALYDAVCESIDNVGKWLYEKDKNGEEMPSKTLVCIMTDGEENSSMKYSLKDVKDRLNRQKNIYNWDFIYLGSDLSSAKDVNMLGDNVKYRGFTSKKKFYNNYNVISAGVSQYRMADTLSAANMAFDDSISKSLTSLNEEYKNDTGIDLTNSNS